MSYENWSSSKSCVKLPPGNMVSIILSVFLNCEFSDRYSSKFDFKVLSQRIPLRSLAELRFLSTINFSLIFVSFFILSFFFFIFAINNQCKCWKKINMVLPALRLSVFLGKLKNFMKDRSCQHIFSFDRVLQNSFF